jgi:uncharacterized protein (DUF305 family)
MKWQRVACGVVTMLAVGGLMACTEDPPADGAPVIAPGRPGEPASTIPRDQVGPAPVTPPNEADMRYVQGMIVHHQQAIEMTALVPERAAADMVKRLADRIADSQRPEIDMMNEWLRTRGKSGEHAPHGAMPGMASPVQLDALRAARGPDFDKLFLQLMITHHEGALRMAGEVQTTGMDVRVQEMADEVIVTQTAEINRMKGILG